MTTHQDHHNPRLENCEDFQYIRRGKCCNSRYTSLHFNAGLAGNRLTRLEVDQTLEKVNQSTNLFKCQKLLLGGCCFFALLLLVAYIGVFIEIEGNQRGKGG